MDLIVPRGSSPGARWRTFHRRGGGDEGGHCVKSWWFRLTAAGIFYFIFFRHVDVFAFVVVRVFFLQLDLDEDLDQVLF